MALAPPVLIGVPDPYDESVTGNIVVFDSPQNQGQRLVRYDGFIYAFYRFFNGSTSLNWRCTKSADDGATWTNLDTAGEPNDQAFGNDYKWDKVILQGSKVRVIWDYITQGGSDRTYQTRIDTFDLITEEWDASYIAGPSYTEIGGVAWCLQDAVLRGLDEIVVLYVDSGGLSAPLAIDIYNTTSATWTTTGLVVFDGSGSFDYAVAHAMCWDGEYIHIFADYSVQHGTPYYLLHVTLDASNTLGTEQDLYAAWDGLWLDPSDDYGGRPAGGANVESVCVHGGKIYAFTWGRPLDPYDANNHQIFCWSANIGEAAPTWTVEAVYMPVYAATEEVALKPVAFVSNGALHCGFLYIGGDYADYRISFVRRIAGTWSSPLDIYAYNGNQPVFDGFSGSPASEPLSDFAFLPDTRNALRCAAMANIKYDGSVAVWYCTEAAVTAVGVRY
jgi:hypothetical protein